MSPLRRLQCSLTGGFLIVLTAASAHAAGSNPWSEISAPASGQAESIGTPVAGCVRGADSLPLRGDGFRLVRPERRRFFGHPELVSLLKSSAASLQTRKSSPLLLIGDLGLPRGGPTLSAHSSHQSGLDADIWYVRSRKATTTPPSMVEHKRLRVSRSFGAAELRVLQHFASQPEVDRVLVHFAIKRELCRRFGAPDAGADASWIRKIRPWFGHDRHFHVRIRCPAKSPFCKEGEPIPPGNGRDATLDWWWSAEARQDEGKNQHRQQNPVMPELPEACGQLLHSS